LLMTKKLDILAICGTTHGLFGSVGVQPSVAYPA
jgi:hypothetical protein